MLCGKSTLKDHQFAKVSQGILFAISPRADLLAAHPDLEVFRLRLGKALDFDYFEDWQGSLFSRADPRSAGPALDVERALNKLEKVALRYKRKHGRPLVLAFNGQFTFIHIRQYD